MDQRDLPQVTQPEISPNKQKPFVLEPIFRQLKETLGDKTGHQLRIYDPDNYHPETITGTQVFKEVDSILWNEPIIRDGILQIFNGNYVLENGTQMPVEARLWALEDETETNFYLNNGHIILQARFPNKAKPQPYHGVTVDKDGVTYKW